MAVTLRNFTASNPSISQSSIASNTIKNKAEEITIKGCFYQKALLPQFHIQSREEAYQLIQEQGHLLTVDALTSSEMPAYPISFWKTQQPSPALLTLDSLALVIATLTFTGQSGLLLIIYLTPQYAELFLDYYGQKDVDTDKLRLIAAFEAFG